MYLQKLLTSANSEVVYIHPHCSLDVYKKKSMFYSYSLSLSLFFATLFLTSRFPLFPQPLSVSASPNSFVFFPPLVNSSLLTVMFGSKFGQRLGRPLEWRLGGVWVCVWVEIGLCLGG